MGVAIYFLQSFLLRHAGWIWFYIADGKRATEYLFYDTHILSNSLSLKLAKLQATRIGTRNATYILQKNWERGGTTFKPRVKQEPKNTSAPGRLRFIRTQFAFTLGKESPLYIYGHFLWPPLCPY